MKILKEIKFYDSNGKLQLLNDVKLFGISNLTPKYNGSELFPKKEPHYMIEKENKKVEFILIKNVIKINYSDMVT